MKNFITFFIFLTTLTAQAQKLPNTQTSAQWIPEQTKIDGSLTEWGNQLKAYNKATRLEYVIANDQDQLYLAFKSADIPVIAKILVGGISFIMAGKGDKKLAGPAITFPFPDSGYAVSPEGRVSPRFRILKDSVSIVGAIPQLKEMRVLNFAGITDSVISIYNEYGIKTKLKYEGNTLACEMLIPRKLIGLGDAAIKIAYQIKLTGVKPPSPSSGAPPPPMGVPNGRAPLMFNILDEINSVTYFSGEYSLAVKP